MGLRTLCGRIREVMRTRRRNEISTIRGIVSGGKVLADGNYYNMSVAVDEEVEDGDGVWVVIDTTNTRAVVVGK